MTQLEMKWTEFTLIYFLVAFLSLFIISDTSAAKNHVVRNGKFGVLRHGTFPSPPLGEVTHVGVDIVAPCGSYIYAFADGRVKDVIDNTNDKNHEKLGYMVLIEHPASLIGKKFYTLYLHMQDSPDVKIGDQITGGSTVIGKVGDTGIAFGCHTHFEIRYFPERFSTWGNIYGPGDQRASEYFKQNWENPLTFIKKYPNGLKLTQSSGRENNTVKVETDKDNQEKQSSGFSSDAQTEVDSNEGVYVGDLVDGVRHGQGTVTLPDGTKYVGGWKDGNWYGQGTMTFPDGAKHVGEYKDGNWHGLGTLTWSNGSKYVGEFKDNKRHGQGTCTYADGDKYVGEWKNGKVHGQGTCTYADGGKYVGEWKDDNYHGQGTQIFLDGSKYVGEFKDGKFHGQGTYTWPNAKYVGEWKDSNKHGQGTQTWPSGNKYVGGWKDNKRHGQGTFIYANGEKYVDEWKDGERYDSSLDISIQSFSIKGLKIGMTIQQAEELYPKGFDIGRRSFSEREFYKMSMEDGSSLEFEVIELGENTKEEIIYSIKWRKDFQYKKKNNDVLTKLQETYGKWSDIYRSNYHYYVIWGARFKNHNRNDRDEWLRLDRMVVNNKINHMTVTGSSYLMAQFRSLVSQSADECNNLALLLHNYNIYDDAKAAEAARIKQKEALNNLELR